ncbi:MAG TPA: hypothetical protein VFS60_13845 [Thermoanaerobaculia bacterium]|nr:hypothetical protein [Thermoanaerobaculia bacterium]
MSTINQGSEPEASSDVVERASGSPGDSVINIRNISVKCGNCNTYQTLASFSRRDEWNVYTYECENDTCDPNVTRTLVEVPQDLDEFANRDPEWRGGKKWGGAEE